MLEVIDISFDDLDGAPNPDDIYDLTELVTVTVGEEGPGNNYCFQLVTKQAISKLRDKRKIFVIEKWEGTEKLISKLNEFISDRLHQKVKDDPYEHLSKYWE